MIPVWAEAQFAEAIRTKVVREIADAPQVQPLVQPAQAEVRSNCLAGELCQRQRSANGPFPRDAECPGTVRCDRP